jgi:hypothetical protein
MRSLAEKFELVFTARRVWFSGEFICLELADGREIKAPLEFYPKLKTATKKQREKLRIIGLGTGIRWDSLDEDLSVEGIVLGRLSFKR